MLEGRREGYCNYGIELRCFLGCQDLAATQGLTKCSNQNSFENKNPIHSSLRDWPKSSIKSEALFRRLYKYLFILCLVSVYTVVIVSVLRLLRLVENTLRHRNLKRSLFLTSSLHLILSTYFFILIFNNKYTYLISLMILR